MKLKKALEREQRFKEEHERMKTRIPWLRSSWPWLKNLREERLYSEDLEQMRDKPDKELPRGKARQWNSKDDYRLYHSFFLRRRVDPSRRSSRVNTLMLKKYGKYPPYACEKYAFTSPLYQEYLDCVSYDWTVAFYVPYSKLDVQ